MATYVFSFPAAAAGKGVTVRNAAGATVNTGTVGAPSSLQGRALYSVDLPAGSYVAEAVSTATHFSSRATGVVDVDSFVESFPMAFVADANASSAATVAASVDLLRDALVTAGLMAAE